MAIKPLVIYPDPVLRKSCASVEEFGEALTSLLQDLSESMYFHKGLGLAASQIGEAVRVAVVDIGQTTGETRLIELVNPRLVQVSEELWDYQEGCLSFPGESEWIRRPARIVVASQDRQGASVEIEAEGLLATAIQHEMDHLDGKLIIDHLSRLKRSLIDRRLKKRKKLKE